MNDIQTINSAIRCGCSPEDIAVWERVCENLEKALKGQSDTSAEVALLDFVVEILRKENAALKDEVTSLRIAQQPQQ